VSAMVKATDVVESFHKFCMEHGRLQAYQLLKAMLDGLIEGDLIEESVRDLRGERDGEGPRR